MAQQGGQDRPPPGPRWDAADWAVLAVVITVCLAVAMFAGALAWRLAT